MEADILHSIGYHQHVDPHGKTGSTTTKTPQTPLRVRFQSIMCGLSFHVQASPRRTKQSHTKYLVFDTGRWHARCIRRWTNAWSKAGWSCGLDSVGFCSELLWCFLFVERTFYFRRLSRLLSSSVAKSACALKTRSSRKGLDVRTLTMPQRDNVLHRQLNIFSCSCVAIAFSYDLIMTPAFHMFDNCMNDFASAKSACQRLPLKSLFVLKPVDSLTSNIR